MKIIKQISVAAIASIILLTTAYAQTQQQLNATDRIALQIGQLLLQVEQLKDQNTALQKQIDLLIQQQKDKEKEVGK